MAVYVARIGNVMTRLDWDQAPRVYDEGVSQGVLYFPDEAVPWNGLVSVEEAPSGEQSLDHYFDGRRLIITQQIDDFQGSVQAYTYPDGLEEYSGYVEDPTVNRFGLSYRSHSSAGDLIHIVYNALLHQSNRNWGTLQQAMTPSLFQWDIYASSINIPGARPASHLIVDTSAALPSLIETVEGWLYGTAVDDPRLPEPEEFVDIFEAATTLRISYNPDGSWTASGPDDVVELLPNGEFRISAPTAVFIDDGVFRIDSF